MKEITTILTTRADKALAEEIEKELKKPDPDRSTTDNNDDSKESST